MRVPHLLITLGLTSLLLCSVAGADPAGPCDGLSGSAFGLCNAWHSAGCLDEPDARNCVRIEESYERQYGETPPWLEVSCPCWDGGADGVIALAWIALDAGLDIQCTTSDGIQLLEWANLKLDPTRGGTFLEVGIQFGNEPANPNQCTRADLNGFAGWGSADPPQQAPLDDETVAACADDLVQACAALGEPIVFPPAVPWPQVAAGHAFRACESRPQQRHRRLP